MRLAPSAPESVRRKNYASADVHVPVIDKPIDIARLQRFITDFEQQTAMQIYQPGSKTRGKVAIIGAGPAGCRQA